MLKVAELFAGVGGFRLGLEGWQGRSASSAYTEPLASPYRVVWSNQWEPSTKIQHASLVYERRFGKEGHSNQDIASVPTADIPDHDVLVGGFPCQDYSVATTLKNSKGLLGKKGVLWWSIHRILSEKQRKPSFLLLENVDRLLISPSSQRGRDFAVILKSLADLGYAVEWRVINAADYGMPQRRKRVFLLAYLEGTSLHADLQTASPRRWLLEEGVAAQAFPAAPAEASEGLSFGLEGNLVEVSEKFPHDPACAFRNSGLMQGGQVYTLPTVSAYSGPLARLGDILVEERAVDPAFYIVPEEVARWAYLKGSKKEWRTSAQGHRYQYSEGSMAFPDPLDKPSRTIITGEGGVSPSRFKHVVQAGERYRRLLPVELERLNMFPDQHTALEGISDAKRAFFMGNALVVGVVHRLGQALAARALPVAQPVLGASL
jgi:DNA (cytosine-5)-methyltransferase 1